MQAILPNLTAAMLLIHSLIGCCWHHEHGCGDRHCSTVAALHHDGCCQHHGEPQHEGQEPSAPDNCRFGCQGACTYLPPQKILIDAPHLVVPIDLPADFSGSPNCRLSFADSISERASDSLGLGRPVRLHLLHQVILV